MRPLQREGARVPKAPRHKLGGYFCWIHHAFKDADSSTWHAFCDPTEAWSGHVDDPVLVNTFTRGHNHFNPNVRHGNVPRYLRVHRLTALTSAQTRVLKNAVASEEASEAHYLINGDSVTQPRFNPWHANADLLNYFIVQRMLNTPSIAGSVGRELALSLHVYPLAGCNGFGPGRGNWDLWSALTPGGKVHALSLIHI